MADGDNLAVMVFGMMLGIGLASVRSDAAAPRAEVLQGLYEVSMRLLSFVLAAAPFGVACLMFSSPSHLG